MQFPATFVVLDDKGHSSKAYDSALMGSIYNMTPWSTTCDMDLLFTLRDMEFVHTLFFNEFAKHSQKYAGLDVPFTFDTKCALDTLRKGLKIHNAVQH